MSGSHSPHSSLATPTPTSLVVLSRNMHSLATSSPAVFNTHISSEGQHSDPGKYTSSSTSPSFASVVSSSAGSSAIPVSPSSFQSQSAHLGSTIAISSSSLAQQQQHQQNLYQHHQQQQKHEQGQTSPPSAALLSNYNSLRNSAPLRGPSSVTSSSRSNRSPSSSSTYNSTLASPASHSFSANQSSNGSTGPDQSGSDSSDVEIYLNTLVLHESASRMQGMYFVFSFFLPLSIWPTLPIIIFLPFPCQLFFFAHIFTHFHRIRPQIQSSMVLHILRLRLVLKMSYRFRLRNHIFRLVTNSSIR